MENAETLVCPVCKTQYPAGSRFCEKDGSRLLTASEAVNKCTICKRTYPDNVQYCPVDGGEVTPGGLPKPGAQGSSSIFSNQDQYRSYPKASLGNRFLAALLDGLVSGALALPSVLLIFFGFIGLDNSLNSGVSMGATWGLLILAVLMYALPIAYGLIKDGLWNGQSVGKRALSIMVVNLDTHQPCTKGTSALRNLISALVAIIPFIGWLIEPIMVLATDDGRKLGDKAARTMVIDVSAYRPAGL